MLLAAPVPALRRQAEAAASAACRRRRCLQTVEFSADQVVYDSDADVVTASGEVRMNREGNYLAADQVVWNRKTGEVRAKGNVVVLTPAGRQADRRQRRADRHAARRHDRQFAGRARKRRPHRRAAAASRNGNVTTLENAIYSPCPVTTSTGCPKQPELGDHRGAGDRRPGARARPFRRRPAAAVRDQPAAASDFQHQPRHRRRDRLARARHQRFDPQGASSLRLPYHWQIGPNRDATLTPHLYTGVLPAIEAKYRELNSIGAFQVGGFLTYGTIENVNPDRDVDPQGRSAPISRPTASSSSTPCGASPSSLRAASDKTVTRRYDITNDDRLRSVINVERISPNSYISIAGWAFQGLRVDDRAEANPDRAAGDRRALPARRHRRRQGRACRRTACRSSASRDRTRSAPSPARDGTCGG